MKTMSKTLLMVSLFAALGGCAGGMTQQQRNTAVGAALGGVIGSQVRTRR